MANRLDKISVCDTYGNHLKKCFEAAPTIVHNNFDEIQNLLNVNMNSEREILSFMNILYKWDVKQAFLTDAEKQFYAMNFDFHYKITLPKIDAMDSTGSGDAFTAGLIYGCLNKLSFEEQLRFASAMGICNAKSIEVCDVLLEDALSFTEQIKINPVGKKIKIINDLPD
jgi:fructose-1-phosphate kinase PfkB-like protein